MAVKAKTPTNGSKTGEQSVLLDPATATEGGLALETSAENDLESGLERTNPGQKTTAVLTDDSANEVAVDMETGPEIDTTENAAVDTTLVATPPVAAPTQLSKMEAIAQVNTANHDLVTLLEPLLTSAVTQKRLTELMVRQIGLSDTEGAAWLAVVKQLLETKRKASQNLVRSLIDQV